MQNFRLLTGQVKFHQMCTLIGYFCWKYIKFQLKKVWRKYVSWYQRVVQNLKKKLFFVSKMTRIWCEFWLICTKKSEIFALWLIPFLAKYTTLDLKKYKGVIFHDIEESCKIWRKTWGLENDMRNLSNFHQNTTWKCQHWYFHEILLSKVKNAWATNLQRSYK